MRMHAPRSRGALARPAARPTAAASLLVPIAVVLVVGICLAFDLRTTLLACGAGVVGVVMLARLEWAVMVVVASAIFADYLALLTPEATGALVAGLLGSWILRRCWVGGLPALGGAVPLAALGFALVLLLAFAFHSNGSHGVASLARWGAGLTVLVVLVDTMRMGRTGSSVLRNPYEPAWGVGLSPARVARSYVVACAVASVCAVVTFLLRLGADERVGGPLVDPNEFAFFLVSAVPLAVALRRGARRTWIYDGILILLVVATVGTTSRGAWLGLAAVLVVATLAGMLSLRQLALGTVVAATVAAVVVGAFSGKVNTSVEQKSAVSDRNVVERLDLWRAAGAMTQENPVLGLGPGSFALYHQDYRTQMSQGSGENLDHPHNVYLEVSAELGLIGLAAWLTLLSCALLAAGARWRADRDPLAGAVLLALVGAAVAAVFTSEQASLPLWLLIALAAVVAPSRLGPRRVPLLE